MIQFILISLLFAVSVTAHAADNVPDTMAERLKACTICHGDEDKIEQHAYFPSINGKPQGYLFNQLRNFRDGKRHYQPMAVLLENMTDDYLMAIAGYFSTLQLPNAMREPIALRPDEIKLAEQLVFSGEPDRDIPACSACHGDALMGVAPFIPGLLGLSRIYITAQFGSWRNGGLIRGQVSDCMSDIAKKLTDDEIVALAKWLPSQPVSGELSPAGALSSELAQRCGSIVLAGAEK